MSFTESMGYMFSIQIDNLPRLNMSGFIVIKFTLVRNLSVADLSFHSSSDHICINAFISHFKFSGICRDIRQVCSEHFPAFRSKYNCAGVQILIVLHALGLLTLNLFAFPYSKLGNDLQEITAMV